MTKHPIKQIEYSLQGSLLMAESVESSDTDDWISELTTAHREVAAMPESPDSSDTDAWILELTTAHVPQDATANLPQDATANLRQDATANLPQDATANLPQDATTHLPQDVTHDAPQANLYIYIYTLFFCCWKRQRNARRPMALKISKRPTGHMCKCPLTN